MVRRGLADLAVGVDVAGDERKSLRARQAEDPVGDALRVRGAPEPVELDELGERGGAMATQVRTVGREYEVDAEEVTRHSDDFVGELDVGVVDRNLHDRVTLAVLEGSLAEEDPEPPHEIV